MRAIPGKQRGCRIPVIEIGVWAAECLTLNHHFPCNDSVAWTRRSTSVEGRSGQIQFIRQVLRLFPTSYAFRHNSIEGTNKGSLTD